MALVLWRFSKDILSSIFIWGYIVKASYIKFLMINDMLCTKVNTPTSHQPTSDNIRLKLGTFSQWKIFVSQQIFYWMLQTDRCMCCHPSSTKCISWFYVLINENLGKMCNFFMHNSHSSVMSTLIKIHLSYPVSN